MSESENSLIISSTDSLPEKPQEPEDLSMQAAEGEKLKAKEHNRGWQKRVDRLTQRNHLYEQRITELQWQVKSLQDQIIELEALLASCVARIEGFKHAAESRELAAQQRLQQLAAKGIANDVRTRIDN